MNDDPDRNHLDSLAARINAASKSAEAATQPKPETPSGDADVSAARIGMEFAVAIVASAGLGWLVDRFLGTGPWGTLLLLILGFGAGLMNVWRGLNGYGQAVGFRQRQEKEKQG